ncbi:MAG: Holliday junction resolvase RuvX [Saprospiraceae bacterium]|nr:Holliday junction resolvase RuvX [Saprospiraceae bacterium]
MARIMGIDYGTKKTGIAVTDTLQIICTGLNTIHTSDLFSFIKTYVEQEEVEKIVVGMPLHKDGNPAQIAYLVVGFIRKIRKLYPAIEVVEWDERGTSKAARDIILQSGTKKSKRRDKSLVDKIAAALILQDYMEQNHW